MRWRGKSHKHGTYVSVGVGSWRQGDATPLTATPPFSQHVISSRNFQPEEIEGSDKLTKEEVRGGE